tara:strand:- start:4346 stop:4924 length:579 start_codon:yes stop_codon:yes gene_type:complete
MSLKFATSSTLDTVDFIRSVTYHNISLFDYAPKPPTVLPYQSVNFMISKDDFVNLFYKGKNKFQFALENEILNILGTKSKLTGWSKSTGEGVVLSNLNFDIVNDIVTLWESDTGISKNDWSSSAYINIVSTLLRVNDWTNLSFSSTLSYPEILTFFKQTELLPGNKLKLNIIVDNDNNSAKPIELILNFEIA